MKHRPDIIILMLDTQRADHLSCYGYAHETSPHIDALASEATQFTQAVSPAQWTLPAHASLFTGLYTAQHTMTQQNSRLPDAIPTLAERLRAAGYFTALFSNNPLVGDIKNGLQRGFDTVQNYTYTDFALWTAHLKAVAPPQNWRERWGRRARRWLAHALGYDRGADVGWVTALIGSWVTEVIKWRGGSKNHNTPHSLESAMDVLINRPGLRDDQPAFVFINLMEAHIPYAPPHWAIKKYLPQVMGKRSAYALLRQVNALGLEANNWLATEFPIEDYKALMDGMCDASVAAQDRYVGHFLDRLHQAGVLNQTLLALVSDHGDHLGEKQRFSHICGAYQELVHVPLIIRNPEGRLPQGQKVETFVSTRRLFHTVLDVAEIATEQESTLSIMNTAGPDAAPTCPEHNLAFTESIAPSWAAQRLERERPGIVNSWGYDQPVRAVYADAHKLIETAGKQVELYAVHDDPCEQQNLQASHPERVTELRALLQDFVEHTRPSATRASVEEDATFVSRLRGLGYLE